MTLMFFTDFHHCKKSKNNRNPAINLMQKTVVILLDEVNYTFEYSKVKSYFYFILK
jgi:hypothetical protein